MEGINIINTCNKETDKDKDTSDLYGINGEEKTSRRHNKKENAHSVYVHMYEYGGKHYIQRMNAHVQHMRLPKVR